MEDKSCWICFTSSVEDQPESRWIHPCKCIGSTRWVHEGCLLKWLKSSNNSSNSLFRYGARRSSDTISIRPYSSITSISRDNENMSFPTRILASLKDSVLRLWRRHMGQVVTISSKLSCPQCKTPYIIVQNENSWILSFLENINYFGSKTLTTFVYGSLVMGGFTILWVHGTFSLLFMYGIEDYTKLFNEIIVNEDTLSEENILSTLSALVNYFSFTLVAIPMIPLFLIVSVLPITSFRHAISIILMGRLYMFSNLDGSSSAVDEDSFQPISWIIPALYVTYSVTRDFIFKRLGIAKKIAERQSATNESLADDILDDDDDAIVAAVIINSDIESISPSSDDEHHIPQMNITATERIQNPQEPQDATGAESPIQSTVRTIATIKASITPIISSLFMPFFVPFTRVSFGSILSRFFSLSKYPVIFRNLIAASTLIVIKDIFQVVYHVERDRLEKSRTVLNYNLDEFIQ